MKKKASGGINKDRYRKIPTRIWLDEEFAALPDDSKLLFFYLRTHPLQTSLGAMRATADGLAAERHWSRKKFRAAWRPLLQSGRFDACEEHCVVWAPDYMKDNQPESPNVIVAWAGAAAQLPQCHLRDLAIERARQAAEDKGNAFAEAFRKAFPKAFPEDIPESGSREPGAVNREPRDERVGPDAVGVSGCEAAINPRGGLGGSVSPAHAGSVGGSATDPLSRVHRFDEKTGAPDTRREEGSGKGTARGERKKEAGTRDRGRGLPRHSRR